MYILLSIIALIVGWFLHRIINEIPKKENFILVRKVPVKLFLWVELSTILAYLLLFNKFGFSKEFIIFSLLTTILIPIFFIDISYLKIPNILVLVGFVVAVIILIINILFQFKNYDISRLLNPLLGAIVGSGFLFFISGVGFLIYRKSVLGMGDIKLFAVIGMFLGWRYCIVSLFITMLLGGIFGLILIITKKENKDNEMPLAPSIAIATFLTMLIII